MNNIKDIVGISASEPCSVDVHQLHETLLRMPAEIYIRLYHLMTQRLGDIDSVYVFPEDMRGNSDD